jgi:Fur family ferric uptake transcriptional regulator
MNHYASLIADMKIKGFRLTQLRKAIIRELDEALKPLSVTEMMKSLNAQGIAPHKTSIYREITFLLDNEFIKRITFGEKQDRFELAVLEHHHHAVCESCGKVEKVVCNDGIREIERMLEQQDFKVRHHLLEFIGLCKQCRQPLKR